MLLPPSLPVLPRGACRSRYKASAPLSATYIDASRAVILTSVMKGGEHRWAALKASGAWQVQRQHFPATHSWTSKDFGFRVYGWPT